MFLLFCLVVDAPYFIRTDQTKVGHTISFGVCISIIGCVNLPSKEGAAINGATRCSFLMFIGEKFFKQVSIKISKKLCKTFYGTNSWLIFSTSLFLS